MVDIAAQVRKHDAEIRAFRLALFGQSADSSAWVSSGDPAQMHRPPRLGPVKSVTDRHAELTIVGDMTEQSALLEDPARDGLVLTLSVAAHHRQIDARLRVDPDEAASWIEAVLGEQWAASTYAAGALSTMGSAGSMPSLKTLFYYVFFSRDGHPHEAPEGFSIPVGLMR
jgi:hypothetical protein